MTFEAATAGQVKIRGGRACQTRVLLLDAAEDWSGGVVPEAERLVAEGPADPTEELRFCPEEKEEWFSSFKKCILWSSKRRGAVSGPPTHVTSFSH